jgi:hypothetical protein
MRMSALRGSDNLLSPSLFVRVGIKGKLADGGQLLPAEEKAWRDKDVEC